tara:strand:+ start:350 stop:1672 length:1323 start_codon:yes stop_codon:yes gene_type:complete
MSSVAIVGLGYVGCVSIGCIAYSGRKVYGVDVDNSKIQSIKNGIATVTEPKLDELIETGLKNGLISVSTDNNTAYNESEIIIITVGTPRKEDGELDLSYIFDVSRDIANHLKNNSSNEKKLIVIRSTIKPGTCKKVEQLISKVSGKKAGIDFSVLSNPEFLREGTAVDDYFNPPYVLIGSDDVYAISKLSDIYEKVNADILTTDINAAEIIKYVNNSWHALKVAFGNEIGTICKSLNINSDHVIDLFLKDKILNISSHYLWPGFAYGGACLPKDLSALVALGREKKISIPLLESVSVSNNTHIDRAVNFVKSKYPKGTKIGVLGISFKSGTDDLRSSPALALVDALNRQGYEIKIFDSVVHNALKENRNIKLLRQCLGYAENLLTSKKDEIIDHSEVLVVANNSKENSEILNKTNLPIIDLVHVKDISKDAKNYFGLAWD